jgi:multiple sugar transport system ATP-binding protein
MAEVTLENVCKVYPGGVKAVDNVSLRIADREFVVLVGPSGCGKSTTLRMIAGLEDISSGTIRIGSRVINDVAPKDRDIAMVFQNYALYPHMNVYRNMSFGLMLRRKYGWYDNFLAALFAPSAYRKAREEREAIDRRVRDAAQTLGITHLLDRKPRALSGGQRQRVAVGRAIVRNPQAYLFDEPLSNLDAKLRVEMRAEIKKIHRQVQTTTVYVTHDQEEAMTLGDRVVVMKDGVIQQMDSPFETYERPVNRFVAGFVGTPPMNFFEGRLQSVGGRPAFVMPDQSLPLPDAFAQKLAGFANQEVTLGIRPDGLLPLTPLEVSAALAANAAPTAAPDGAPVLDMSVTLVEPLGDRMDVIGTTQANDHVIARVDSKARVPERTRFRFRIAPDRMHFFAPGPTGRNLLLG